MSKNSLSVYEYDRLVSATDESSSLAVPPVVFNWLEEQSLREEGALAAALSLSRRSGRKAVQVGHYAGILKAPNGYQIEVLPKTGKHTSHAAARQLLMRMLRSAPGFRHIQSWPADIKPTRMPLLEVFIGQFLANVERVVKRGLRHGYVARQDNTHYLRGKLKMAAHLRHNVIRRDRFYNEFDEFLVDRPENRVLHAALLLVLERTHSGIHQRLARELEFAFSEVPVSADHSRDFASIHLERTTAYYKDALDWARLLLDGLAPIAGMGKQTAPSLLFPMDALFEAHVERKLRKQLAEGCLLKRQARSHYLVEHRAQRWFNMKPDLLIERDGNCCAVLDTKWKLLDAGKATGRDKYNLSQADFYQLYAYGHHYLGGEGDVVLVYPKTELFAEALPVFTFPQAQSMRLWVVPYCMESERLLVPTDSLLPTLFSRGERG